MTLLEVTIALGIVTVLVSVVWTGLGAQRLGLAGAWNALAASQAATSRLETLRAADQPLVPGETTFVPGLAGASAWQRVREVEPGLYEVEVEIRDARAGTREVLVTRMAREVTP